MTTQPAPRCPRCASFLITYTSVYGSTWCNRCGHPLPPAPAPVDKETAALVREALAHMPRAVVP